MRSMLALFFLLTLAGHSSAVLRQVVLVGHFSNLEATEDEDPHTVSGYSVHLYREGQTLFGNIAVAVGSQEPAQGRLNNIIYDPRTGTLRFTAEYVSGWTYDKQSGPAGRQARETLTFSGKLSRLGLIGRVLVKDSQLVSKGRLSQESLRRTTDDYKPESKSEWAGFKHLDMSR